MNTDMMDVIVLERPIVLLVEPDENCHDFAQAQLSGTIASSPAVSEQLLVPEWFKALAEVIDGAEKFL